MVSVLFTSSWLPRNLKNVQNRPVTRRGPGGLGPLSILSYLALLVHFITYDIIAKNVHW